MIYKLNNGGIVKLQNAGSVPEYGNIEQIAKYNREHGTNFYKMSQVIEHDKQQAQQKTQDKKKSFGEILAGHPESAGEAILNETIETANNTKLPETRKKIYNDTAKQLAGTTATSLGTVALLALSGGVAGPVVADIVNTGFGAHGLYNALSGNGIQKTVRLANQGDTGGAVKSGAGDLLDLSMGLHAAKLGGNLGKSILAGQSLGNAYRGNIAGRELSNGVRRLTVPVTDLQRNIEAGKIGGAPATTKTLGHNSNDPISELKINFPAGDVIERNAPLGHVGLTGNETTQGFIGTRPYHLRGKIELNKPMIQIGETIGDGKNVIRNQILDFAQKSSADGINFQGIADNTLQNQDVYAVFKDVNIKPKLTEAERLGISKGERSNPKVLEDPQYGGYQQGNQRYNDAVKAGNGNEVQRLRDLHFKIKVPSDKRTMMSEDEPFIFAHTTDEDFNIFNSKYFGKTDAGYHGRAFYFGATVPTEAKAGQNFTFKGRRPIHNYGKNKKYFYIKGSPMQLEPGSSYDYFSDPRRGIFFNLNDPIQTNEFLIGHPEQIKLSDAMTFNDNGTLIPIVKRDNFHNPDIRYKQGGILKAQHGILTPGYNLYNSKVGEFVRNSMFGKDYNLSNEEYVQKHGYAKPITGTGMLPGKTSMNAFEGVENLVKGSFGTGAKYNAGQQIMKTNAISKTVQPKTASNWDKFLKKSLDEQNKIVKYGDERYSTMRQLQANQKQFKRFVKGINKQ